MKLYIAGPMSGLPEFNYPAFFAAEKALRQAGYETINPARTEGREGCKTWQDYMRAGVRDVADSDGVALLPGWQDSRGAVAERDLARSIDLSVEPLAYWLTEAAVSA